MLLQNERRAYLDFLEESGLDDDDEPEDPTVMQKLQKFLRGFAFKPTMEEAQAQ